MWDFSIRLAAGNLFTQENESRAWSQLSAGQVFGKIWVLAKSAVAIHVNYIYSGFTPVDGVSGLQITAGQQTMSGLIADLTGQTPVLPVNLTSHFWIQTLYFPDSCRLMLYNAAMIS